VSAIFLLSENPFQDQQKKQDADHKPGSNQQVLHRVLTEDDSVHHPLND
jgi:hypothetical protein